MNNIFIIFRLSQRPFCCFLIRRCSHKSYESNQTTYRKYHGLRKYICMLDYVVEISSFKITIRLKQYASPLFFTSFTKIKLLKLLCTNEFVDILLRNIVFLVVDIQSCYSQFIMFVFLKN